jgi:hypothetical protein
MNDMLECSSCHAGTQYLMLLGKPSRNESLSHRDSPHK